MRASACGIVRGNPSRMYPSLQSGWLILSITRSTVSSSGTRSPWSMNAFAFFPSSVPFLILARKISPVEMCGIPYFSAILCAWVPFPAPGAPNIMIFIIVISSTRPKKPKKRAKSIFPPAPIFSTQLLLFLCQISHLRIPCNFLQALKTPQP